MLFFQSSICNLFYQCAFAVSSMNFSMPAMEPCVSFNLDLRLYILFNLRSHLCCGEVLLFRCLIHANNFSIYFFYSFSVFYIFMKNFLVCITSWEVCLGAFTFRWVQWLMFSYWRMIQLLQGKKLSCHKVLKHLKLLLFFYLGSASLAKRNISTSWNWALNV